MTTVSELPAVPVRDIRDLPGPRQLPLLGNALVVDRTRLHQQAERWAREFGPVYRFRITTREFVVMSDPEMVATVLRDRPDGFQRTQRLNETAREFGFDGLFSSNGDVWRRQRSMVLAGLDPTHIKSFFPTLVKVTGRLARRWQRAAEMHEAIDLQSDLMRYTVDVTAGLAFGTDINTVESREEVIQQHLDKIFPALFKRLLHPIPYWRYVKLPSDRQLDVHLRALRVAVDGFIDEARRRIEAQPQLRDRPTNLIESMVAARDRKDSGILDEDVVGNVLTMLLAGEDTTANTLAWMIWLLHRNPDAARRATEEVRSALGSDAQVTHHDQLHALDFVEACAHETMRLKPVAPLNIQQAVRDSVVGNVRLPAGTLVMCLMRPAAVDERHFPNAQAFRPDRWLANASASSAKRVTMPFGAGPRICPGRYLALAEMKTVIAMLLGRFEIADVVARDGREPQERLALTMSPVGLTMRLR
jgi:cytochrome P450